jgi:hypothetical protein
LPVAGGSVGGRSQVRRGAQGTKAIAELGRLELPTSGLGIRSARIWGTKALLQILNRNELQATSSMALYEISPQLRYKLRYKYETSLNLEACSDNARTSRGPHLPTPPPPRAPLPPRRTLTGPGIRQAPSFIPQGRLPELPILNLPVVQFSEAGYEQRQLVKALAIAEPPTVLEMTATSGPRPHPAHHCLRRPL